MITATLSANRIGIFPPPFITIDTIVTIWPNFQLLIEFCWLMIQQELNGRTQLVGLIAYHHANHCKTCVIRYLIDLFE